MLERKSKSKEELEELKKKRQFKIPAKIVLFFLIITGIGFLGGLSYRIMIANGSSMHTYTILDNREALEDINSSIAQINEKGAKFYQEEIRELESEKELLENEIQKALVIEPFGFSLLVQTLSIITINYILVFIFGIVFWIVGPYHFKLDRWFMVCIFIFYIWALLEIPTVIMDLRFIQNFDPSIPITDEIRKFALSGHRSLGAYPILTQLPYLVIIVLAIFKPGHYKIEEEERGQEGKLKPRTLFS